VEKKSTWMKDPKCYLMLKEKADGIKIGALKFPILFKDTIYLLPSEVGDKLIQDGYAIESKPKPIELKELKNATKS